MINTVLLHNNTRKVLSFYRNELLLDGKVIKPKHPQSFNNKEKEMVKDLIKQGINESLALFFVGMDNNIIENNVILKWLMIRIFHVLYNRRNVVAGGCIIILNENFIIIGDKRVKWDKNKLIELGKLIFGY